MHLVVSRSHLHNAFQAVSAAVAPKTTKPVLQGVKMAASADQLTLMATDLEVGIRQQVSEVTVKTPGECLVPAARLGPILRESMDEELEIRLEAPHCLVHGQDSDYRIITGDPAEFPEVPDFQGTETWRIPGEALGSLIRRTEFATDVESTRYALNGVLLDAKTNVLNAVATDGRRLALARRRLKPSETASGIVPLKALNLIQRAVHDLEDKAAEVSVILRSNEILVSTGQAIVWGRLLEGRFPKYEDVIPTDKEVTAEMEAGQLLSAVRRAAILTSDTSRGVTFSFEAGRLVLTSRAAEYGESTIRVAIGYDAKPLSIIFNPQYLEQALRVLPPETKIHLDMVDGEHAAVLRAEDDYQYVIMPLTSVER